MTLQFDIDCIVTGAGVVGLAVARSLALRGREVVVVDRHPGFGMETSSRNSEVIHAGIYYAPNSLKARFCVEGRMALYRYCDDHHVAYRNCGKLIVASGAGEAGLEDIIHRAEKNGVGDLERLTRTAASLLEPSVECTAALFSPSTGIIDSHALMQAYLGEIQANGGQFAPHNDIDRVEVLSGGGFAVYVVGETMPLITRTFINAAGLSAASLASRIDALDSTLVPEIRFARGVYFALAGGKPPFRHLVYPLPDSASLGVHATIDLGGAARFGPDVEWIDDASDYYVDPARAASFKRAIESYWPAISDHELVPAYAGIRPKLCGPGDPAADFRIDGPEGTGIAGLCCLYGIESPGLTASLAIGEYVAQLPGL